MVPAMAGRSENRPTTGRRKAKKSSDGYPDRRQGHRKADVLFDDLAGCRARRERPRPWSRSSTGRQTGAAGSARPRSRRSARMIRAANSVAVLDSAGLAMTRRWRPSADIRCPRTIRPLAGGHQVRQPLQHQPAPGSTGLARSAHRARCLPGPAGRSESARPASRSRPASSRGATPPATARPKREPAGSAAKWSSSSGMSATGVLHADALEQPALLQPGLDLPAGGDQGVEIGRVRRRRRRPPGSAWGDAAGGSCRRPRPGRFSGGRRGCRCRPRAATGPSRRARA